MANKILKYYEIVKLFLKRLKFKTFRSHPLYITTAVVVYIGESSQYCKLYVAWYGLSQGSYKTTTTILARLSNIYDHGYFYIYNK